MTEQVVMDAKFTLFAIIFAIAIASPINLGKSADIPDLIVVYAEWPNPSNRAAPLQWINLNTRHQQLLTEYGTMFTSPNPEQGTTATSAIWCAFPVPPGKWDFKVDQDCTVWITTRDRTVKREVKANTSVSISTK